MRLGLKGRGPGDWRLRPAPAPPPIVDGPCEMPLSRKGRGVYLVDVLPFRASLHHSRREATLDSVS